MQVENLQAKMAIIGGTGFYKLNEVEIIEEFTADTPFGKTSPMIFAKAFGHEVIFVAKHGLGHSLLPSEIPYKANIAFLRHAGVRSIFSFSAVGSLKEEIRPRDFVLPTSIIDRTKQRSDTFFGEGVVAHIAFGDPFCPSLSAFFQSIVDHGTTLHSGETIVCIEGPAFSTRAESKLYKSFGAGIINMTVLPEAKLAREAGICYQMICMVTDYDSFRDEASAVTAEEIMAVVRDNSQKANRLGLRIIENLDKLQKDCQCHRSLEGAIITPPEFQKPETRKKLHYLFPDSFA